MPSYEIDAVIVLVADSEDDARKAIGEMNEVLDDGYQSKFCPQVVYINKVEER